MAVSGWMIFFGLLWAYIVLLVWLYRSGRMQKWDLSVMLGLILMIRTQRGKKLLDRLARPRRLWNAFGDFGTVLTLGGMVLMTLVMLLTLVIVLDRESGIEPLAASEILVIPGVNPFVPLWYGIAALIITLVVHEGGHGVLARANDMKVKSLGLLFAIVPIGAFVEPDEEELQESPRRNRLRVFAAGATINIVLAFVLMFAFAAMVDAAEPVEGVPILGVTADSAAQQAGLATGDVMIAFNGTPTPDAGAFTAAIAPFAPGDNATLTLRSGALLETRLGDRFSEGLSEAQQRTITGLPAKQNGTWPALSGDAAAAAAYCDLHVPDATSGGSCADNLTAMPFLGISYFPTKEQQEVLASPFGNSGANFLYYVSLPIGEVRGQPILSFYLPEFFDEPFEGYWEIATLIFWVFWINLMVGLTNILPMLPLDGGHIFRDAVGGFMAKARPRMDKEVRERFVGRLAGAMSLIILGAFLLQILGPRFL